MQFIRTEVARSTTQSGDPLLRVLFLGQGGDRVVVDMASVETDNDEEALKHAQAILVQTANFGLTDDNSDRYRESDDARAGQMFIFEYRDAAINRQVQSGIQNLQAAREEALRRAVRVLADQPPASVGWVVRVLDQNGEVLHTIDIQEAEQAREALQ
jgi:hypothetical protein